MTHELLLEIGAEEIPSSFVMPALEDLRRTFSERAQSVNLQHGDVRVLGTPRRLALHVKNIASKTPDVVREVLGPSWRAAFDGEGKPTRAAVKFAEGHGVSVEQLRKVQSPKGDYVGLNIEEKGKSANVLLPDLLHAVVHSINFKKSMRWGDVELSFARPVRWLVALFDEEVVPVIFGDVKSGRTTQGHRFLSSGLIELRHPRDYETSLRKAAVIVDIDERKTLLKERLGLAAKSVGATIREDDALVDQVNFLTEQPYPVIGEFSKNHLDLPAEVLVQEMRSHQRYFSLNDDNGKLLPKFIAVSNTPVRDPKLSLRGYERVLQARLSDGRFFFDEDRRTPLVERTEKLHRVVWQGKLGSYAEKVDRLRALAIWLAKQTKHEGHLATIERAATLSKADLVTGMVGEFPELQGVMGREYALADGEPREVAVAIYEHYLPRFSGDQLPSQTPGALLGIADRLDSLSGIFAIGKIPSGAADPFGLRRACLAIIHVVSAKRFRFSLGDALDESLKLLASKIGDVKRKADDSSVKSQLLEFFRARLKALWCEDHRADVVESVLSAGFDDLVAAQNRLETLSKWVGAAELLTLSTTFRRVANIVEKQGKEIEVKTVDSSLLLEDEEKALFDAWKMASAKVDEALNKDDYESVLKTVMSLRPEVDTFFEKVMVMAEDRAVRENRIRLLRAISQLFGTVADFSKLQVDN